MLQAVQQPECASIGTLSQAAMEEQERIKDAWFENKKKVGKMLEPRHTIEFLSKKLKLSPIYILK
jgi:5-methylcytosine-specific restriction endonuclease McrBC GTP-binding regulatory subunit McrB